jgi:hypothetical protein
MPRLSACIVPLYDGASWIMTITKDASLADVPLATRFVTAADPAGGPAADEPDVKAIVTKSPPLPNKLTFTLTAHCVSA